MDFNFLDSSSDAADDEFWNLADSSSDEEFNRQIIALLEENLENGRRRRRGSVPGRKFKDRQRCQGHQTLYNDYFAENPIHGDVVFRRRFQMHRPLFLRILTGVEAHDSYFVQKKDLAGRVGLSSLQKVTAAMRMLAYGVGADVVDDYLRIGESTAIEAMRRFVFVVSVSRPPGRKAEKRKLKETDKLTQIEKLHLEKKERDDKKLQIMKEKVEVDKEKLRVRKLEFESKKIEAEMRIMSMNTSTMNPEERAYYSKL